MALVVADRVQETTSTTGTSSYALLGAATGYQSFGAVLADGDTTYYAITNDTDWEVGVGTYSTTGPTLARTTILASSSGGSAVNWGVGVKNIFISYAASKASFLDANGALLVADKIVHTGDTDTAIRFPAANTMSVETGGTERLKVENSTITTTVPILLPADPTLPLQAATKEYVDTLVASGIHFHQPVRVESPINLNATYNNGTSGVGATLTNAGTQVALVIDGVTVATNDRVLVYEQTDQTQNGVYVVTSTGSGSTNWVLTRSADADSYVINDANGLSEGSTVFVQQGTTGAGETYTCNTSGVITFGTTAIVFAQISSAQVYSAGTGLALTGTVFSNTAPDQVVALTQGGATTITGTYPNFTISSVNTTYTAGGGIGLTTTEFSVAAGSGLTQDADGLSHADTSSQASVDNSGATFVQDINLDGFGHVTGAASVTVTPSLIGAPQSNGTGATGTWGISISGNANNVSGTVSVSNGGTGATTVGQARTNLDVPTRSGGDASGTWGINVTGYSTSVNLGNSSAKQLVDNVWAGGGGYPGYSFTGGNSRFGFSSTSGVIDVYADGNFYATDSSHLVLHAGNYTSYAPSLTGSGASGTWGINVTGSAGSVAWGSVTSKPSNIMYYQGFTLDANTMDSNSTGFTYSVNAPLTGPVVRFSAGGSYDLWLNANYGGGNGLYFRTRNGDNGTLNPWRDILHSANYNSYSPTLTGGNASGTWGININGTFNSSARSFSREWIEMPNHTGLYSPLNAAHFYPNNGSYGSWKVDGSRNGWQGIEFQGQATLMMNDNAYGIHRNIGGGWRFYLENGNGYFPGNVTAYWSDERLKENLVKIDREALSILGQISAFRFNWNSKVSEMGDTIPVGKEEIGLIAQHVQRALPDAVVVNRSGAKLDEEGFDYLTINYDRITPLLVEATNIHEDDIASLKEKIAKLEALVSSLIDK